MEAVPWLRRGIRKHLTADQLRYLSRRGRWVLALHERRSSRDKQNRLQWHQASQKLQKLAFRRTQYRIHLLLHRRQPSFLMEEAQRQTWTGGTRHLLSAPALIIGETVEKRLFQLHPLQLALYISRAQASVHR